MSQIIISNLTFAYAGSYDNIFENLNLSLDSNWKLGLIGPNGRGKTTFLHLLQNKYPYKGSIVGMPQADYFPYHTDNNETNAMQIISTIAPDTELWQIKIELGKLQTDEDILFRPYHSLSGGEQTKLQLAALLAQNSHFLLIDEPTNHLDLAGRQLVANYLKKQKSFIVVSHDRSFLDGCVDHILSLNKTAPEIQRGNFSSWLENKNSQDNFEFNKSEQLKKEISHLKQAAERNTSWAIDLEKHKHGTRISGVKASSGYLGAQAARMMKRAKTTEARIEKNIAQKELLLHNLEQTRQIKLIQLQPLSGMLVKAEHLSLYYNDRLVLSNLNFCLKTGQRLSVDGQNGCGKSTLLKAVCAHNIKQNGLLKLKSGLVISYLPQTTSHLKGSLNNFAEQSSLDQSIFLALLRQMGFTRTQFEKALELYSEGQKKKVLLAKSLSERAHLYLWDEPLNYVDIFSRMQIEELLLTYKPTMIFVEHDQTFSNKIATDYLHL
ncbi:MAG: ABC-F type ribosomal protection protein [Clostridia bacterium]|nr:ABC-F type ribosomal protection protein [Clostridia bacterium]MDD4798987.1 ABC-F type ribosomal protection protein [Clostridia bacterium]